MNISQFQNALKSMKEVSFRLPNGESIPSHFHITEVGKVVKHYIDCGGQIRQDSKVNFQIWVAEDLNHRLAAEKLLGIIQLSLPIIGEEDLEVEFEYQGETIEKYGVDLVLGHFILTAKQTDCLAKDKCGIPESKPKKQLADLTPSGSSCCTPGGGCC